MATAVEPVPPKLLAAMEAMDAATAYNNVHVDMIVLPSEELARALRVLGRLPQYTQTTCNNWDGVVSLLATAMAKVDGVELAAFALQYPDAIGAFWRAAAEYECNVEATKLEALHAATGARAELAVAMAHVWLNTFGLPGDKLAMQRKALETLVAVPGLAPFDVLRVQVIGAIMTNDVAQLESLVATAAKDGVLAHAWASPEINYWHLRAVADATSDDAAAALLTRMMAHSPSAMDAHHVSSLLAFMLNDNRPSYLGWSTPPPLAAKSIVAAATKYGIELEIRALKQYAARWAFSETPAHAFELLGPLGERAAQLGPLSAEVHAALVHAYVALKDLPGLMNLHRHARMRATLDRSAVDRWYYEYLIEGVLTLTGDKNETQARRGMDLALALLHEMKLMGHHHHETELDELFYPAADAHGYTGMAESFWFLQGYSQPLI
ncbi:hypothetical protein H9P43_002226 [Blastocladiella emersonii ATCC 22665]|nr:hypothetical protein H9P43_002226 [Blastocladiella emersonii ATCC 22665]